MFHAIGSEKAALYLSDKIDYKTKTVIKDKEWYCIMIKRSIQQDDITFINIYAPNIEVPRFIKQILTDTKGKIDSNTIIIGYFNTPLTLVDRSSKHKINKYQL